MAKLVTYSDGEIAFDLNAIIEHNLHVGHYERCDKCRTVFSVSLRACPYCYRLRNYERGKVPAL